MKRVTLGDFTNAKIQLHPTSNDGLNDAQYTTTLTQDTHSDNVLVGYNLEGQK